MKVGIVGSRNWTNYEMFKTYLTYYQSMFAFDMIISGGATGVDAMAYRYAIEKGITFVCHPPKPEDGFPAKFTRRNLRIVEQSEIVVAFPMGPSKGTRHSISLCQRLNKPVCVIEVEEP